MYLLNSAIAFRSCTQLLLLELQQQHGGTFLLGTVASDGVLVRSCVCSRACVLCATRAAFSLSKLFNAKETYTGELSAIARQGSGSACRRWGGSGGGGHKIMNGPTLPSMCYPLITCWGHAFLCSDSLPPPPTRELFLKLRSWGLHFQFFNRNFESVCASKCLLWWNSLPSLTLELKIAFNPFGTGFHVSYWI